MAIMIASFKRAAAPDPSCPNPLFWV